MTRSKNWQCPYCEYEASRRWNAVEHIRVIHRVVDQPIDKRNSGKGRNTSSSNLKGTHIDRRPSPSPYNTNRSSIDQSNQASNIKGDMIDDIHQMLTEIEKKRRKVEEIKEIVRKYLPFPIQTPITDFSNATIKDKEKIVPLNILRQDKPHSYEVPVQTHNYRTEITRQKTKTEKAPQDPPQVKKERLSGGRFELNIWSILMAISGT